MRFLLPLLPLFSLVSADLLPASKEVTVNLSNPTYKNGILYTNQGGVIQGTDLRIQAKSIQYTKQDGTHRVEAEGDLLIQYKGRVYVGSELEYDLDTQSGVLYDGKTFSSIWYVGGDKIFLHADGSYKVVNAFITTCENIDSSWDFHAGRVEGWKSNLIEAKKVRFRLFKIPAFWFPSFKVNLKKFKEPIFRYSINWDKGQGPRASIRYQLYSWQAFAMYGRVEYRWKTGWGGAFETEYFPSDHPTTFVTRSYLGTDRLETAPDKMRRYRLQGSLHSKSRSGKTVTRLSWDKYSDVRMPSDFKSDDFEVDTAHQTIFKVWHKESGIVTAAKFRPRVNTFETLQQDLPTFFAAIRPIELGQTGILATNYLKASYLDFTYSNHLTEHLSSFHSTRVEMRERLQRPFQIGALTLCPEAGVIGIFYGNSPSAQSKAVGVFSYGIKGEARAWRHFNHYRHQIEPYASLYGLSTPTTGPDGHYIFSIQDGYDRIQQLQLGIRNLLFSKRRPGAEPSFTTDLFANAFTADATIPQWIPRLYLHMGWRLPSLHFTWKNCWNFRNHTVDYSNARFQWTLSENSAFSLEARYRSPYDWRKSDHENFILDVTRSESELLLSPLSDRRITLLTSFFFRLNPFWECQIQSHHGFYRTTEDPYNEVKVDLFTWLSSALKLRLSYSHTDKDDRVTAGVSLVRK